jgi:hypothetical protein
VAAVGLFIGRQRGFDIALWPEIMGTLYTSGKLAW